MERPALVRRIDDLLKSAPDSALREVLDVLEDALQQDSPQPPAAAPSSAGPLSSRQQWMEAHSAKKMEAIVDQRQEKIRAYQDALLVPGSHADALPGCTQIGNMKTATPSMTDNWDRSNTELFLNVAKRFAAGAPPVKGSVSSQRAFRVA